MNSTIMKAILSANFRFQKQFYLCATEAGRYNSDFFAIKSNGTMVEIEIKISKADFNNDFKKDKHRIYENAKSYWTPNYFYFAIPNDQKLIDYAVGKLADSKYGLIVIKDKETIRKSSVSYDATVEGKTWRSLERQKQWLEQYRPDARILEAKINPEDATRSSIYYEWNDVLAMQERVKVLKKAKKLHKGIANDKVKQQITARLTSEMANLRIQSISKEK